ncbi:MAG: site-specific integrase [Acidimicrobiales bacterium]
MAWHDAEFLGSLSSVAPRTIEAYRRDLAAFTEWAERGEVDGPEAVDRTLLRRYVAHLSTRRYAERSIARKVSTLRRYFRWATRRGLVRADPSARLSAPRGDGRLPRVLKQDELTALLDDPTVRAGDDPVRRASYDA